jgi:hypothetical protein
MRRAFELNIISLPFNNVILQVSVDDDTYFRLFTVSVLCCRASKTEKATMEDTYSHTFRKTPDAVDDDEGDLNDLSSETKPRILLMGLKRCVLRLFCSMTTVNEI